ncbi:MAG: hypothetical protein KUG72_08950 [Pseudomonadales bacterium]|nr:hypothetical protein [Pseudomonadales bacterium]
MWFQAINPPRGQADSARFRLRLVLVLTIASIAVFPRIFSDTPFYGDASLQSSVSIGHWGEELDQFFAEISDHFADY